MASNNGMGIALLGGGALALVLLNSRKASAAQPGTPTPSTPSGGGSSPAPSSPSGGGSSSSDVDDGAPQEQGDGASSSATDQGDKELDQLDAQERAEALAAAREAARQEAALEAKQSAAAKQAAAAQAAAKAAAAKASGKLQAPEPAPTPNSSAAKQASGMVTAPFSSMPAAKPSTTSTAAKPASSSTQAKALAPSVVANLNAKGTAYDRKLLAAFQAAAGLTADGLYGPATQAALVKAGSAAPKALFKAASTATPAKASAAAPAAVAPKPAPAAPKPAAAVKPVTVSPSTSKVDLAAAKRMAADVAANLRNKGKAGYDRKQLASFQEKAGITADGIYGPLAVAALKYFGANAPAAFFAGSVKSYTPPAAA